MTGVDAKFLARIPKKDKIHVIKRRLDVIMVITSSFLCNKVSILDNTQE